jgi:hypothetical protein
VRELKGDKSKIALSVSEGVCGRCHEEEPYHRKNIQWKNSGHATGATWATRGTREIDTSEPDFRSECAYCHSPVGFIERMDPAAQILEKVGLTGEPLTCAACHDPHSAENVHQLRLPDQIQLASGPVIEFGGKGRLCMSCHQDRRAGGGEAYAASPRSTFRGPHHSNQTDMLAGASEAVVTFGRVLPNSTHKDAVADACVTCHMADNGRDDLGEHSWAMHTEEIVGTDTVRVENVAACVNCHGPITSFDDIIARADHDGDGEIEPVKAEVEGLLHDLAMMLPPFGLPEVDSRAPEWNVPENTLLRKAAWNWAFVDYDHSHGIHNYQFAVALLQVSIQALEYGVLDPGSVLGVEDVPMDQGKQVGVAWNRFGGLAPRGRHG